MEPIQTVLVHLRNDDETLVLQKKHMESEIVVGIQRALGQTLGRRNYNHNRALGQTLGRRNYNYNRALRQSLGRWKNVPWLSQDNPFGLGHASLQEGAEATLSESTVKFRLYISCWLPAVGVSIGNIIASLRLLHLHLLYFLAEPPHVGHRCGYRCGCRRGRFCGCLLNSR